MFLVVLVLITLLVRDLPYFNVLVINRIWIVYLLALLLIFLSNIRFHVRYVVYFTLALFVVGLVLTLLRLTFFADGVGVIIYFALWIILIHRIFLYFKQPH